ncbi:hypothetical protein E4T44_07256 [Aureobasidium sp. EXF-8845]|nr:hypothetical protein E4T44_07256 [Aureobasidium sp. EXF-8845]KAI4846562.1 hypothetical protein E4T45_07192 [Aureobasidium sp. EXF-8846]
MAPKGKDLPGPVYKYVDILKSIPISMPFHANLIKTREMTSIIEVAFQKLNTQIHSINASGPVSAAIDPIKRKIRRCKEAVLTATESARCQQEVSATYIEQGRFGDALTAINEGLIDLCGLKKRFVGIRDSLAKLSAKDHTIVTEALEQIGFDKEFKHGIPP